MSGPVVAVVGLLMAAGSVGCGGSLQHGALPFGTDASAGGTGGSNQQPPQPREPACGGMVQTIGTTPYGSFDAHYIFSRLGGGDCGDFLLTIAQTDHSDSDAFSFDAPPQPDGSWLGITSGTAWYFAPGSPSLSTVSVGGTITISAFPNPVPTDLRDAGDELVVGSFSIDAPGFSVMGTFSTPICRFNICI
jgi:hypothetical protein